MELHSGKKCRYDRHQIAGVADPQKIPEWAVDKLLDLHTKKELDSNPQKSKAILDDNLPAPITVFISNGIDEQKGISFSLPATAETLNAALAMIDVKDGNFSISNETAKHESIIHLLPTASRLDELNMLADFMKDMRSWEVNKLDLILKSGVSDVNNAAGLINLLYEDNFSGFDMIAAKNTHQLGMYWELQDPDILPEDTTYAEYGEQCVADEKGVFIDDCYVYQRRETEPLYIGIVPDEYKITPAPIEEPQNERKIPDKTKTETKKKPTLQEKLDKAKKKAAEQGNTKKDERGDKPKKHDERE
jgi:hypothetical protein